MTWYDGGDDPAPEPPTRRRARRHRPDGARHLVRWRLGPRAVAGALIALALIGGAVALRSAAASPSGPAVDLPEPRDGASVVAGVGDGPGGAGAAASPSGASTDDPVRPGEASGARGVVVHVVGQVGAPGVVTLPEGSRVTDAVTAAGGALPGADLSALNLAAVLTDGAQVRVPAPGEPVVAPAPATASKTSPDQGAGAAPGSAPVDLNAATAAELDALPGIGPVLAERIIGWRTEHGRFAAVDDLRQVSGIGPAVMERLRDLVRV